TIPPVLAATLRKIPTLIHEQNAVMGRANRFLAPRVDAIATSFAGVLDHAPKLGTKATRTGNPVRPAVVAVSGTAYAGPDEAGAVRLVVFGGSQGARIMADIVPAAVEKLPRDLQARLAVVQQARDEDLARVTEFYARTGVAAEVAPFFADLPARIAGSHVVIARSGASTVAELAAIGRPAILVPLPHALDQDQSANAGVLASAGGAMRLEQKDFTPDRLAAEIAALASAPQKLVAMAAAARSQGATDAAERLADLVLRVATMANSEGDTCPGAWWEGKSDETAARHWCDPLRRDRRNRHERHRRGAHQSRLHRARLRRFRQRQRQAPARQGRQGFHRPFRRCARRRRGGGGVDCNQARQSRAHGGARPTPAG